MKDKDGLIARRRRVLGEHLALFYREPLQVVRGEGVWLYDEVGQAYLDAYNNVPVTGHCHPHVVEAIAQQVATLNTHTRYLYPIVVEYAERLTSLLPDHLLVCSFVNSGSEANDIAWRMAKFVTGNEGALVMEGAYHGITEAVYALSPEEHPAGFNPPHVQTLPVPDLYREPHELETALVGVDEAIADLADRGMKPAAFMVDPLFVSNDVPTVPEGYLALAAQKVREAGGLIIADEVQAGFGRSGEAMWGHELHNIEADIVTMGKPVGAGFPLGVVVTRPEILNSFVKEIGLFSTFGGNPVACAAGMAVLDVMEQEGLQANAKETGDYLRACIRGLMEKYEWIGDVRGRGLLIAVELVRDRGTREPAIAETQQVINWMREERVLIGKGGKLGNTLKIRPPLVFKKQHADILVTALDKSLSHLRG